MSRSVPAVLLYGALSLTGCTRASHVVHMSTTTSVENSGLLADILPAFESPAGIDVQVVSAGSGRALAILEHGDADIALTHDPNAEDAVMRRGAVARYQKLMYNDFVIAGPPADPADLRHSPDALDAMRRIVSSRQPFASRADSSGTHAREQQLWKEAAVHPDAPLLLETGSGMAATLRVASEREAYVLTDRATFLHLAPTLRRAVLHEHDSR